MLIIACMDGASASARRTHTRMYMSDVVEAAAKQHLRFKKNDLVICRETDYLIGDPTVHLKTQQSRK